jgi:amino acid permease
LNRAFGPIRKGALRAAILTLLASAMGTGIFNLPERVEQIGIIPFVFFVTVCGFYSYLGMELLSELIRELKVESYSDMA